VTMFCAISDSYSKDLGCRKQPKCYTLLVVRTILRNQMIQTVAENEQAILSRLREGDPAALDELFGRHYAPLCRTALRFVNNEQEAEDIVQELFVSLWEKRAGQREDVGAIGPYLRRAVRNRSLNYLRDSKRIPVDDGEVPETIPAAARADDALSQEELRYRLHGAIDRLPERCRLVFVMSKLEEMTNKEIAKALEISPKTVENQMTRAYRFLRQWLALLPLILTLV